MLQNLMNEAAIYAVRSDRDTIAADDVDSALDRLTVGQNKETGTNQKKRQELVAWHEAGHAVMAALTPGYDPVAKVTIVPRSNGAGGFQKASTFQTISFGVRGATSHAMGRGVGPDTTPLSRARPRKTSDLSLLGLVPHE